jgi:hypothetical protein
LIEVKIESRIFVSPGNIIYGFENFGFLFILPLRLDQGSKSNRKPLDRGKSLQFRFDPVTGRRVRGYQAPENEDLVVF